MLLYFTAKEIQKESKTSDGRRQRLAVSSTRQHNPKKLIIEPTKEGTWNQPPEMTCHIGRRRRTADARSRCEFPNRIR
jgi:hypothetical protein